MPTEKQWDRVLLDKAKRVAKHRADETEIFCKHFTNHKGEPCRVELVAEGEAGKLIIFVHHEESGRKDNRYVSVLGADIMDEVADAWLAYRQEETRKVSEG